MAAARRAAGAAERIPRPGTGHSPLGLAAFAPCLPGASPVLEMLRRPFVVRSKGRLPHGLQQARALSVLPRRPLPACRAPGFPKQPTCPPSLPPSPNAPASQVPTLPRLLLPAWNTRLAFRTQARLGRQPRAAQGSRPQSGFPTRPRRAASSPRARAEPGHVWSPRAPGTAFVRLAPKASGPNGHVSGESVKNG